MQARGTLVTKPLPALTQVKNIRSCKFHDGGLWSCTSAWELHERSWRAARALVEIDDGFCPKFWAGGGDLRRSFTAQ